MLNEIKVKAIFGAHQIYQEIANYPPENVRYLGISQDTSGGKYYQNKKWKEKINKIAQKLKVPRMMFVGKGNFDLIHTSRGVIPLQIFNNKPWIMDLEYFSSFMGLNIDSTLNNKRVRKFIENRLSSRNCKKILCHCEATKKSMLKYFNCSGFENKLEVLYPSSHIVKINKEKHKNIRILCILSLFEQKGGKFILEAFKEIEKKYKNVELWIKADVPEELKKEFSSKNIKYFKYHQEIIPREELIQTFYSKCDIFVYPTFCDSFGYSLIDAMIAKLPIIATNLFAVPEMVVSNKNGFVVKIPCYDPNSFIQFYDVRKLDENQKKIFIKELKENLEKLIKYKNLREKMGQESFKMISEGKFSIKERNKKLRSIYEEVLK